MFEFIILKSIDLTLLFYKVFNRIFALSSDWLNYLFFFGYFSFIVWSDASRFSFDDHFSNFINSLFYMFLVYGQWLYTRTVKKLKNRPKTDISSIQRIEGPLRFWHEFVVCLSPFIIILSIFSPLAFCTILLGFLWHSTALYYVDYGGKSLYSKIKDKVKNTIKSKTPVYSPSGV